LGGKYVDYGTVTTPVLHYMVVCGNHPEELGESTPLTYYKTLSGAFTKIMTMVILN
jgi:hypothetical protein